jgi:DNA-binding protein HU-beta
MNKHGLAERLAEDVGLTRVTAIAAVESVVECITKALEAGEQVTLVGFGTFAPSERKARQGRNPATGETLEIPQRTAVRFTAGQALKKRLNR